MSPLSNVLKIVELSTLVPMCLLISYVENLGAVAIQTAMMYGAVCNAVALYDKSAVKLSAMFFPTHTKRHDLYPAWIMAIALTAWIEPKSKSCHKNAHIKTVDAATIRFASVSTVGVAKATATNATVPNSAMDDEKPKMFCRITINNPAMTRVHECSNEETGVGPSIASGNHKKVHAETDLNIAHITKSKYNDILTFAVSCTMHIFAMAKFKNKSPHLLKVIAKTDARVVAARSDQCAISRNEINPMHSHATSAVNSPLLSNSCQTA